MESVIFPLLQSFPDLTAIVSNRVYPLELPQGAHRPAVTYVRAGGNRDYDMEGATGLVESRYFFKFHGAKSRNQSAYGQATSARRAMVDHLSRRPGFTDHVGTVYIQGAFINGEREYRSDAAASKSIAVVELDVTFWHSEMKEV